jgi:D-alanyl-D-alanine carboxypeptidase/D-alanyl-D-alanine-endopeptidase (penicillin-binding protein 4)
MSSERRRGFAGRDVMQPERSRFEHPMKMLRRSVLAILSGLCFAFGATTVQAEALPEPLATLLNAPEAATGIALFAQPLDAASPVLAYRADAEMNPASTMKLLTMMVALDTLGPAYTWETRLLTDGVRDGDRLAGNLYVRGTGDPALTRERFWLLLQRLQESGIRRIDGDILLDDTAFALPPADPAAFDGAPRRAYNSPPGALLVDFNTARLRIRPQAGTAELALEPLPEGFVVDNLLQIEDGACGAWRDALYIDLVTQPAPQLRVSGIYRRGCGERSLPVNLLPPSETFAAQFQALWRSLGGELTGRVRRMGPPPESAVLLLRQDSPPLASILRDIGKWSNNVMARNLYLTLGAERFGWPATLAKSEQAIRDWLRDRGLSASGLVLENGSGLSRVERVKAAEMAHWLVWAGQSPLAPEFLSALPLYGIDGTTRERQVAHGLLARLRLKTGTLRDARNLAGYGQDCQGRPWVLLFFMNGSLAEDDARSAALQDAFVAWWAKTREVPCAQRQVEGTIPREEAPAIQ